MNLFPESVSAAIQVSIQVSFISTILATIPGIWLGMVLGLNTFKGRDAFITALYTALAFPTVVIGLFVYMFLSRTGPLGSLGLLYTKTAIVIGQCILITPIIAAFTLSTIRKIEPEVILTAKSLGATGFKLYYSMLQEVKIGIFAAVIAAFGRAISEVGVSMILGGNIAGFTRTMTTMIALEHDKGQFRQAVILGAILLSVSLSINVVFHLLQQKTGENRA